MLMLMLSILVAKGPYLVSISLKLSPHFYVRRSLKVLNAVLVVKAFLPRQHCRLSICIVLLELYKH